MSPITLLDASAVAFVVAVVGEIRSQYRIPDRFVPLIPVLVAQLVALLVVYISKNGEVGKLPVFLVTCMWEGVKTAALAMSAYKIGKTTVLNSDSSGPMEARRDDSTRIRQVVETLRAGLVALGLAVLGFLVGKWTAKGGESPILPRVERPLPGQAQESSEQKAATERDKRARGLRTALRRLLTGGLVVLLSMGFAGSLGCGAEEVSDQPYIPQTYDELLKYYREAVSLLQRYDVLYQEADASNKALLQANAELRALVKKQQDFIATRDGRGRFGVIGGVTSARGSLGLLLGVLWTP